MRGIAYIPPQGKEEGVRTELFSAARIVREIGNEGRLP
jgi:hypothetical protein